MGPEIVQHPLARADGSTVYSDGLYTIIAGVNGPVEVQRRDEIPDAAAIEVNVRPSAGVGGPRERWLEGLSHAVLRTVLLVHLHPRTLVQVTLQIAREAELLGSGDVAREKVDLALLPALVNAAFLALIDSGLPVETTMCAVLAVARGEDGQVVFMPGERDLVSCRSVHALAFDQSGAQLLEQSAGNFDMDLWERVVDGAREVCVAAIGSGSPGEDEVMDEGSSSVQLAKPWLRNALEEQAKKLNAWRQTV